MAADLTVTMSTQGISTPLWYLLLGTVIAVAGLVRLLLVRDLVARLIALNVTGTGSSLILLSLGARQTPTDPVFAALVITGLVITVAFTGLGAVLIRRIEADHDSHTRGSTTADGAARKDPA